MIKRAQDAEKSLRIALRNANTVSKLQEKLRLVIHSPAPVFVFSVSNKAYENHRKDFRKTSAPALTVDRTDIPDLRQAISRFPNQARLTEVKILLNSEIPAILSKASVLLTVNSVHLKANLVPHIEIPKNKLPKLISQCVSRVKDAVNEKFFDVMEDNEDSFIEGAKQL